MPRGKLGIQLYTVRDQIQALGFAAVFKELNRYGYDSVEFVSYTQGTGDLSLRQLKRLLRDHGLRGIGSHVGYYSDNPADYTFATQLDKVVDDAAALGLPHVGTAASPDRYGRTVDAWKRAAEDFNTYGAAARKRGLKFYQHNHQMEFGFAEDKPNVRLYDVLLAETDPELVYLEMDIYWAFAYQHRFSVRADGTPAPSTPSTTSWRPRTATRSSTSRTANTTRRRPTATTWSMSATATSTTRSSSAPSSSAATTAHAGAAPTTTG